MRLEELHRFETPIIEFDGRLRWNLYVIDRQLRRAFARARGKTLNLRSLSTDSWAVDYVPTDGRGNEIRYPYCYRDRRTDGVMDQGLAVVSREEIFAETGIQFLPFNTLWQAVADLHDGEQPAELHLSIAGWFDFRFGGVPAMDLTMASATQMWSLRTGTWAPFLGRFGIDPARWPRVVRPGTIIGYTPGPGTTRVIAGCSHDTAAAVAAVPAAGDRPWAYVSCGTWSLLGAELREPILTAEALAAGFTNEAGLDGTIRFLKNLTGLWTLQECMREWNESGSRITWEALLAEAAVAPSPVDRGRPGRIADVSAAAAGTIDLEDPRFTPRGSMQARLEAATRAAGLPIPATRGALARLVLESIADSYRRALASLDRLTGRPTEVLHLVGGGSRNALLCRLAADACGIPVIAGPEEATALGNLLVQARTMGDLPQGASVREIAARSSEVVRYEPGGGARGRQP